MTDSEGQDLGRRGQEQERALDTKEQLEDASTVTRYELAQKSFDHVLSIDHYMDNKASRTLSAMAFLTGASAAVFAAVRLPLCPTEKLSLLLSEQLSTLVDTGVLEGVTEQATLELGTTCRLLGHDWSLLMFASYMVLTLLGAALYLGAIGPSFNIPTEWRIRERKGIKSWLPFGEAARTDRGERRTSDGTQIKSLLFFDRIGRTDKDEWTKHWSHSSSRALSEEMTDCFVSEAHLIAQKINVKVVLMESGNYAFRFALLPWIALIACLFTPSCQNVSALSFAGWFLLFTAFSCTSLARVPRRKVRSGILAFFALFSLVGAVLSFLGVLSLCSLS